MQTLSCFKAYDIRGMVPDELNEDIAYALGRAYVDEFSPGTVVVGRDVRLESQSLSSALCHGLNDGGADVIDIGLCGTEEVYFQTFHRQVDGGIMITASHNPKGYNGMKLVRESSRPISGDSGLFALRDRIQRGDFAASAGKGLTHQEPGKDAYIDHLLGYVDRSRLAPLRVVANPGNGCAGSIIRKLENRLPFEFIMLQEEPDGTFPNGIPNPLLPENRDKTAQAVINHKADLGIAWDGDFDRCFLFDADGRFIEGYYIVGLLAKVMLEKNPGAKIIHDPRLTWNTIEQVRLSGGMPVQSKTGHAFIKERMRAEDAVYGGEMSAHHYFKQFAYCDSGMIPWLLITELMTGTGSSLAQLVDSGVAAYPCSGEINFHVADQQAALARVLDHFAPEPQQIDRTDGVSVEFADWRFNMRGSNTEPLLRLNVEARGNTHLVADKVTLLKKLITTED